MFCSLPDDLELKPLRKEHAGKINEAWHSKFSDSKQFIEDAIEYNLSMGMYNKKDELIAWNMR